MKLKIHGGENLLSTTEVGELLRTTGPTVIHLAEAGKIDGFKLGRVWRFRRDSIEQYINQTSTQGGDAE
jgi:excisionase family DNA binding protein